MLVIVVIIIIIFYPSKSVQKLLNWNCIRAVLCHYPITDRVTRAKPADLIQKILETNGFAQALCGEFIRKDRSTKVRNRRRCSSLFSLSKSHVRKLVNLSVNCGFRTRVLKPRNFLIVKDFSLIFATQAAL